MKESRLQNISNQAEQRQEKGITRRDFLEMAAAAAVTAILYPNKLYDENEETKNKNLSENFDTTFIKKTIEKKPFSEPLMHRIFSKDQVPSQSFFTKWCEINDSIVPKFVSRREWEKTDSRSLEKNEEGKSILILPEDLQLWEMLDFIEKVDGDTFNKNPELRESKANEIFELGKIFQKAGSYLMEYLPEIENGREIAKKISEEFYSYGLSLQKRHKPEKAEWGNDKLAEAEKEKLDEWFLGVSAYQKRMARLGDKPTEEAIEKRRIELLRVYFDALAKNGYEAEGEKPWETKTGPFKNLHEKTKNEIVRTIETPEREMKSAIYRRGIEFLKNEMGFNKLLDILKELEGKERRDWKYLAEDDKTNLKSLREIKPTIDFWRKQNYETLYDALEVPRLKKELAEIRKTGDNDEISLKELAISLKIEYVISNLPFSKGAKSRDSSDTPSGIIKTQFINCVGASMLGGAFLDEFGIKYLYVDMPGHSSTWLITSNGKIYWQDFIGNKIDYIEIDNSDLPKNITTEDILLLYEKHSHDVMHIDMQGWKSSDGSQLIVDISNQETGLQCAILNNTGNALSEMGKKKEAIEAFNYAISIFPKYANAYYSLGNVLYNIGRKEEAIKAYKKFLTLQKDDDKFTDIAKKYILENLSENKI